MAIARLDKSRQWVLCGRDSCGTRFLRISDTAGVSWIDHQYLGPGGRIKNRIGEYRSERLVWPETGWIQGDDGVWALSNYAKARFDRDWKLASGGDEKARRRLQQGWSQQSRRAPGQRPGRTTHPMLLPAKARCPVCGAVNDLYADVLDVADLDPSELTTDPS
jgi:hypothetical protein